MCHGVALAAVGIAIGLVASLAVTRLLGAMLYEVKPGDPITLIAVTLTPWWESLPGLDAEKRHRGSRILRARQSIQPAWPMTRPPRRNLNATASGRLYRLRCHMSATGVSRQGA